jgi:hypothetical protein
MAVKTQAQLLAQVASLLADNSSGDISALDVRTCLNDLIDSASYGGKKVYKALLTQTGTAAPVAIVLENTLSGTPVWSRSSKGIYYATLASEFTINKTACMINASFDAEVEVMTGVLRTSANQISVSTGKKTLNEGLDDTLLNTTITIEVYP